MAGGIDLERILLGGEDGRRDTPLTALPKVDRNFREIAESLRALNAVSFNVRERRFGAVADGVAIDRPAIQAAIDAARDAGGGTVVLPPTALYYKVDRALQLHSDVTLYFPTPTTRVLCEGVDEGIDWPFNAALFLCNLGGNLSSFASYAVNNVSRGATTVTTTTAGDAANFQAGDVLLIAKTTTYASNSVPTWAQMNVVKSVNSGTGVLGLQYNIDSTETGLIVRRLSRSSVTAQDGLYTINAVKNAAVIGGVFEGAEGEQPGIHMSGVIGCEIHPHKNVGWHGVAYSNLLFNNRISCQHEINRGRGVETAFCSAHNDIRIGTMTVESEVLDGGGGKATALVWVNEGARHNRIRVGTINAGAATVTDVVRVADAEGNDIEIVHAVAPAQTRGVQFEPLAISNAPGCFDNTVTIRRCDMTAPAQFVGFQCATASLEKRNAVLDSRFFGTLSGNNAVYLNGGTDSVLRNIWCEDGALAIGTSTDALVENCYIPDDVITAAGLAQIQNNDLRGVISITSRRLRALNRVLGEATVTNAAANVTTITVPANTLKRGDAINLEIQGFGTGSNGTKTIDIATGGGSIYTATIATGTTHCKVSARLMVGDGVNGFFYEVIENEATTGAVKVNSNTITMTADFDIVVTITVAAASDTFSRRHLRVQAQRATWQPAFVG